VACGDINPYLLFSLVLGAALVGIEEQQTPPAAISGNAYAHDVPRLPTDWSAAIAMFKTDPMIEKLLPRQLIDNFCLTKEQELERLRDIDPSDHWKVYLETV
jgi:glutamine synthetase